MNKKILIVDFNGTTPTYTFNFTQAFKTKGHDIRVLGFENKKDLRIYNHSIEYIGLKTKSKLLNYFINWIILIICAKRYSAIHFQWLKLLEQTSIELLLVKILKFRNANVFYTVHNVYPHGETKRSVKNRFDKLYQVLDNLVVHTENTKKTMSKLAAGKNIIEINHGLFFSEFANGNNEKRKDNIILMLGRILKYKGIEDALEAMKILKKQGLNFKFFIKGTGNSDYIIKLKNLIKKFNLSNEVTIKSEYVDVVELINLYNKASLTLMPYKKIEQSGVVFTSLGLFVPVVAYREGGLTTVIKEKINGRLVPKNNIKALSESIKWVLNNKNQLIENIKTSKDNMIWDNSAEILLNYYFNVNN